MDLHSANSKDTCKSFNFFICYVGDQSQRQFLNWRALLLFNFLVLHKSHGLQTHKPCHIWDASNRQKSKPLRLNTSPLLQHPAWLQLCQHYLVKYCGTIWAPPIYKDQICVPRLQTDFSLNIRTEPLPYVILHAVHNPFNNKVRKNNSLLKFIRRNRW